MDEAAYRATRGAVAGLACVFEKALLAQCADCGHAARHALAEREAIGCRSAGRARQLRDAARHAARALGVRAPDRPGRRAAAARDDDAAAMRRPGRTGARARRRRRRATSTRSSPPRRRRYGALSDLPWPAMVAAVAGMARPPPPRGLPDDADLDALVAAVRTNCHISDARHARRPDAVHLPARDARALPLGARHRARRAGAAGGGRRLDRRSARRCGSSLEEATHVPLPLAARAAVDPFDVERVNRALVGRAARLRRRHRALRQAAVLPRRARARGMARRRARARRGPRIRARPVGGAGRCRATAPIYVRLESLRRWLWERAEAWRASAATARSRRRSTATASPTTPRRRHRPDGARPRPRR